MHKKDFIFIKTIILKNCGLFLKTIVFSKNKTNIFENDWKRKQKIIHELSLSKTINNTKFVVQFCSEFKLVI